MWGLIPLPYKLIGAGAVLAVCAWGVMHWRTALIDQGRAEGRVQQQKEDAKILEAKTAAAQAEIDGLREALAVSQDQNAKERTSLRQVRRDLESGLDQALQRIRANQEVSNVDAGAIPDAQLSDAIRAQLGRLRTADSQRASDSTGAP